MRMAYLDAFMAFSLMALTINTRHSFPDVLLWQKREARVPDLLILQFCQPPCGGSRLLQITSPSPVVLFLLDHWCWKSVNCQLGRICANEEAMRYNYFISLPSFRRNDLITKLGKHHSQWGDEEYYVQ
jgi:hypothetical protein